MSGALVLDAPRPLSLSPVSTSGKPLDGFVIDKLQTRCTRLRKNLGIAAKSLTRGNGRCWMLTLTYKRFGDWHRRHTSDTLQHLRKWAKRAFNWTLRYLWVMESKKRLTGPDKGLDVPHYHLLVWLPLQVGKETLRNDVDGWWPHGRSNCLVVVAAVNYVMKYASKFDSEGSFPKGARCYGIGGLDDAWRAVRRWVNWPSFVQARASVSDSFKPQVGGGWVNCLTGQWWPSEYGLSWTNKKQSAVVRIHDHGRPMQDVRGPFNWINESARDSLVI